MEELLARNRFTMLGPRAARLGGFGLLLLTVTPYHQSLAQYLSNQCGTSFGVCTVNPAPIGSRCGCYGPRGLDPGQRLPLGGIVERGLQMTSEFCQTFRGRCETFPAPVGSSCSCYGDLGTVVPP